MDKYFFNTGTVTRASKGRDILRRNGIEAYVQAAGGRLSATGCGFGIVINGSPDRAKHILQKSSIPVVNITRLNK